MINNTKIQAEQGKVSLSANPLNKDQIQFLNRFVTGNWKYDTKTGLVDVYGDLDCGYKKLEHLKFIRFGNVSGDFCCSHNQLTSLEGAPQEVGGGFYCNGNQLISLEGAPQKVGSSFSCQVNQLTSLEGAPQEVGGGFDCSYNQLTSLEGAPQEVGGGFYCSYNQLTSLEGAPQKVGGDFRCSSNQLISLEGAPQKVGGDFSCRNNQLTSLEGAPQEVGDSFYCSDNTISEETFKGIYREMKGIGYLKALEKVWSNIPLEDQVFLYRDDFEWILDEDRKTLQALGRFNKIKSII